MNYQIFKLAEEPEIKLSASAQFSSVTQSCLTLCDSLDCSTPDLPVHHQLPRVYSNSCPLSSWCHPTVLASVVLFCSSLQSFPTSGSFPMRQFFASGGQSIRVSASTSVLPMNSQDWSHLGWTDWSSLMFKRLSRVFSNTTVQKASIFRCSTFFRAQVSHPYKTTGKTIALTRWTFVGKVMLILICCLGWS